MFVFIDDSGDPGVKFAGGSSTHIYLAAVIFANRRDAEHAIGLVREAQTSIDPDGLERVSEREFKYSKTNLSTKQRFFEKVRDARFHVRAIMFDKRNLHSSHLRENPNDLKSYLIMQLMTHTFGTVQNAALVIDGQDTRAFNMSDRDYFMNRVNTLAPGTLARVQFEDSKRSHLLQLADMTVGALRKHCEEDPHGREHFTALHKQFQHPGDIWEFREK